MTVVKTEEHQVFVVPAEGRILHPYIQPRDVDSWNVLSSWELHQAIHLGRYVVQVPGVL